MSVDFPPLSIVNGGVEGRRLGGLRGTGGTRGQQLRTPRCATDPSGAAMRSRYSVESRDRIGFGEFILTRKVPLTRFKPCRFWELERQAHSAASHARSRCCFCSFCRCTFIFRFRRKSATHAVAYTARARRSSSLKMRRPSWLSRSSACCSNLRFVCRDLSHQIASRFVAPLSQSPFSL